jgi:DNA-binding LacI/PurR family transcriptional regulator
MPYSKVFYPKLTTISTDLNLLAEATLDSIRSIIKSKSRKKTNLTTTLLPVEVVKRRTHIK